jgi:hypothetical protein
MPGDWQLYAVALAVTVALYGFLSWVLGKNRTPFASSVTGLGCIRVSRQCSAYLGVDVHCALEPVGANWQRP